MIVSRTAMGISPAKESGRKTEGRDGRVECVPESTWPQPPSFVKYAKRASFSDIAEASARVRGRRYPVRIRAI